LLLNYFGQGALVLTKPATVANPFYYLAPSWAVAPLVVLATAAAVIASQALISGTFSITMQAIQLGYLPRTEIRHTSSAQRGQVYLPLTNWLLCLACFALVLTFQDSSHLAAAYGVAVTLTMIITSILFFEFTRCWWEWPFWKAALLTGAFLTVECLFFTANAMKIGHGGWVPLMLAGMLYWIMVTWKAGRRFIYQKLSQSILPLKPFLEELRQKPPQRVRGTAVFMAGNPDGTPIALLHNLKHNYILHERAVLLTMVIDEAPHLNSDQRVTVEDLGQGFYRVIGRYGFMERASVGEVFHACKALGLNLNKSQCTFFLSRETIITSSNRSMMQWRKRLFAFLARNAQPATTYFALPPNRVVELGMQIEY
jgi:KUP system potassium uptake protein